MKAYLAIKFKEDYSNKKLIEDISNALETAGIEVSIIVNKIQDVEPDVLMVHIFKMIDGCDFTIVEISEKGVGLGIEAGYTFASGKPVILIAKKGTEISETMKGIAKRIYFYEQPNDLIKTFTHFQIESKGVTFIIMRPDGKFLLQQRDEHSKRYKNMWCFPGGACEESEEYLYTLIREVKEEYELDIQKENCEFLMTRVGGQMQVYICKVDGLQEPVMHEGKDMKWSSLEEIKTMTLGFNQKGIVDKLEEYLNK